MMARPKATASAQTESRPMVAPIWMPVTIRPSRPRMAAASRCQGGRWNLASVARAAAISS
jgi:hypothetical protein